MHTTPPPSYAHLTEADKPSTPWEPKVVATLIDAHLKRLEADVEGANATDPKHGTSSFYHAWCRVDRGSKLTIQYISYQGNSAIELEEARHYLSALEAGYTGHHAQLVRERVVGKPNPLWEQYSPPDPIPCCDACGKPFVWTQRAFTRTWWWEHAEHKVAPGKVVRVCAAQRSSGSYDNHDPKIGCLRRAVVDAALCPVCGQNAGSRWPLPCPTCQGKIDRATAAEAKAAEASPVALYVSSRCHHIKVRHSTSDRDERFQAVLAQLASMPDTEPVGAFDFGASGMQRTVVDWYGRGDGPRGYSDVHSGYSAVPSTKERATLVYEVHELVKTALDEAYDKGLADGTDVLKRLASGSISLNEFNEITIKGDS